MVALQTGESVDSVVMGVFNPQRDALAWISVSARLVPNEQTQGVRGVYAIFEDITQRKQAEQEIQPLYAGLEQRVAERTASLAAEIAERQRLTEQLSVREAHYRRLNADLEHHAEERIAQIRAAVAALRESEARYHAAFEGSLDAIVISRLEGGEYLDVNQGLSISRAMSGMRRSDGRESNSISGPIHGREGRLSIRCASSRRCKTSRRSFDARMARNSGA
jgi:PAS domain-containing protein